MLTQSNKTSEGGKQNQPLSLRKKIIRTFKTFEAGKQKGFVDSRKKKKSFTLSSEIFLQTSHVKTGAQSQPTCSSEPSFSIEAA